MREKGGVRRWEGRGCVECRHRSSSSKRRKVVVVRRCHADAVGVNKRNVGQNRSIDSRSSRGRVGGGGGGIGDGHATSLWQQYFFAAISTKNSQARTSPMMVFLATRSLCRFCRTHWDSHRFLSGLHLQQHSQWNIITKDRVHWGWNRRSMTNMFLI